MRCNDTSYCRDTLRLPENKRSVVQPISWPELDRGQFNRLDLIAYSRTSTARNKKEETLSRFSPVVGPVSSTVRPLCEITGPETARFEDIVTASTSAGGARIFGKDKVREECTNGYLSSVERPRTEIFKAAMCNSNVSPHPGNFFPDVKGNLTKIVWAHAVNSVAELEKALSSEDIMMLEADVVIGKLNNSSNITTDIPIMAHPPATESDLSLEDFLNITIRSNSTKGIKLDFKSNQAFESSKPILAKLRSNLKFPVFLNADILSGPVNATTTPLDAKNFLKGANDTVPECTLSIGWTTRYGKEHNITEGRYTSEHIKMMIDAVTENRVTQPITYPVRAGLATNDIDAVKTLIKNTTSTNATLTIWSSEGDTVDAAQLSKLIKDVGIDKVYVDVPEALKNKLDFSAGSTMSPMMSLGASLAFLVLARML